MVGREVSLYVSEPGPPADATCFLCHKKIKDYRHARGVETPSSLKMWAHSMCIEMQTWDQLVARYHDAVQQYIIHEQGGPLV